MPSVCPRPKRPHHVLTAATLLVGVGVASLPWVRLNLSSSLPRGLYRFHAVPATVVRARWSWCPPRRHAALVHGLGAAAQAGRRGRGGCADDPGRPFLHQ